MKRHTSLAVVFLAGFVLLAANGGGEWDEDGWQYYPDLKGFTGVELKADAELTLFPGNDWELRVRGDSRDVEDLDIYVSGGNLIIRQASFYSFTSSSQRLEIEVTLPRLTELISSSSGNIRSDSPFESGDLELVLSGSGDMFFEGIADVLSCRQTGSGDLEYRGRANTLDLKTIGSGDSEIDIRANMTGIDLTGSGDITLRGDAEMIEIRLTGSGEIRAEDFPVDNADIKLSGSGDIDVRVSRELKVVLTGSGSVYYYGNPEYSDVQGTGSGTVRGR